VATVKKEGGISGKATVSFPGRGERRDKGGRVWVRERTAKTLSPETLRRASPEWKAGMKKDRFKSANGECPRKKEKKKEDQRTYLSGRRTFVMFRVR